MLHLASFSLHIVSHRLPRSTSDVIDCGTEALLCAVQWQLPSPGYAAMTSAVKEHYHLPDRGLDKPLKIVISLRSAILPLSSRVLSNAQEIANALQQRGFNVEVGYDAAFQSWPQQASVRSAQACLVS